MAVDCEVLRGGSDLRTSEQECFKSGEQLCPVLGIVISQNIYGGAAAIF